MKIFTLFLISIFIFPIYLIAQTASSTNPNNLLKNSKSEFFIENKGQWPKEVRFLARIGGMNAWITDDGIVYDFYKIEYDRKINYDSLRIAEPMDWMEKRDEHARRKGHVVKMTFAEHSETLMAVGINKLTAYYNYFIGNDSTKWASFVPLYKEVLIKNVYDGIDYRLYFENGMLRYDLNMAPFADIEQIQMKYEGQNGLAIKDNGELVIKTSIGEIKHQNLYAYQENRKVECNFQLIDENTITFKSDNYDKSLALTIDPLLYSTFIGGEDLDWGNSLAINNSGEAFITGYTFSSDYPTTSGAYDESQNGSYDVFVTKLNSTGSDLIYSTFIGGGSDDYGNSIAINTSGEVFITGNTSSSDYPTTSEAYDESWNGRADVFVTKLNSTGSDLIYSTFIGGGSGQSIAINTSGEVFITGNTSSSDYPTTSGAYDESKNGDEDVFVTKLNSTGSDLIYSTFIGGGRDDGGYSIAINSSGAAFITGGTTSSDYPTTSGAYDESFNYGWYDAFVTKLNSTGSDLIYSTFIGGGDDDWAISIAINSSGAAFITGSTGSSDYPTTSGAYDESWNGLNDGIVTKLNSRGSDLLYSTFFGGGNSDSGRSLAINSSGEAFITGSTGSPDYPTTSGAYDESQNGSYDVFVTKIDIPSISGIVEFSVDDLVSSNKVLYPNPATDKVLIDLDSYQGKTELILQNTIGQTLLNINLPQVNTYELDISNLSPGLYLITLRNGTGQKTYKLIKK